MTHPRVTAAGVRVTQQMDRGKAWSERIIRCMDDMLLFNGSIEDKFSRVGKFLQTRGYRRG